MSIQPRKWKISPSPSCGWREGVYIPFRTETGLVRHPSFRIGRWSKLPWRSVHPGLSRATFMAAPCGGRDDRKEERHVGLLEIRPVPALSGRVRDRRDRRLRASAEQRRSEEHTSELQSLMRNSYAVFCLQ